MATCAHCLVEMEPDPELGHLMRFPSTVHPGLCLGCAADVVAPERESFADMLARKWVIKTHNPPRHLRST